MTNETGMLEKKYIKKSPRGEIMVGFNQKKRKRGGVDSVEESLCEFHLHNHSFFVSKVFAHPAENPAGCVSNAFISLFL